MTNGHYPNNDWLRIQPPEGEEAQWFKERNQNNRRAKFRSPPQKD
jgi:hypothetical protein